MCVHVYPYTREGFRPNGLMLGASISIFQYFAISTGIMFTSSWESFSGHLIQTIQWLIKLGAGTGDTRFDGILPPMALATHMAHCACQTWLGNDFRSAGESP